MKLPLSLLAGLATGAGLRLLWPDPTAPDSVASAGMSSPSARAKSPSPAREKASTVPSGPVTTDPELRERARGLLRGLGLSPGDGRPGSEPSWLYVNVPEGTLLKSEAYIEASIVATEPVVDEQCAALFVQLGLPPEKEERLRRTLAEMVFAGHEISALARNEEQRNGARPPPSR